MCNCPGRPFDDFVEIYRLSTRVYKGLPDIDYPFDDKWESAVSIESAISDFYKELPP